MTDKEKLTSYGNRLQKLKAKYDAGNLSLSDKVAMKNELDAIKESYEKDFGLPSSAKSSYGYDIDAAINQATSIGADIQTRIKKTDTAIKAPTDPLATTKKESTAAKPIDASETKSLKRKKIENGYIYRSDDGGKTYTKEEKATADQIKEYDAHKAKKESEKKSGQGVAKPKSDVAYDVYNPETIKAAEEKGYTVNKIDPSVQYTGTSVGRQRKWDPESGFYYDPTVSKAPGKAGLDYYMKLHEDAIADYGGPEKWKKDHLEAANKPDKLGRYGRGDKAIEHVINKVDQNYYDATGKRLIDKNKPDWNVPGVQLFNLPGVYKKKEKEPEKELPELTTKEKETKPAEEQDVKTYTPTEKGRAPGNAPWWLQDIIKTSGAAADLARVKKYQPWQATPAVTLPDATFYDPTRELAANTEAANLAMQAQQAFTNPQQLAAASSLAQGQMAKNAADIMGRYNNLNVGLANQLEQQRTDIINTTNQNKANLNTQLWDKYTIANQQFDNARAQARQKLRQSYMDAITNKAKTQALNTLYPNFQTDPSSGGYVYANPNYNPNPTVPTNDKEFDEAVKKYGNVENATKYMDWKYGRTAKNKRNSYEDYEGYQS